MLSRTELEQMIADFVAYKLTGGFAGLPEEVQSLMVRMDKAVNELMELRSHAAAAAG